MEASTSLSLSLHCSVRRGVMNDVALAARWNSSTTWINTYGSFSTGVRRPSFQSDIFHSSCVLYFGIFLPRPTPPGISCFKRAGIEKSRRKSTGRLRSLLHIHNFSTARRQEAERRTDRPFCELMRQSGWNGRSSAPRLCRTRLCSGQIG